MVQLALLNIDKDIILACPACLNDFLRSHITYADTKM